MADDRNVTPRDRAIDLIYDSMRRRGFGGENAKAHAAELIEAVEAEAVRQSQREEPR